MVKYSIKELEHLSGIKAHTIRIWEQRYGLLSPQRTETNIRYYSDNDLKLLLNVALLHEKGYKISKIAGMAPEAISEAVLSLAAEPADNHVQVNAMVLAMIGMDEEQLNQSLNVPARQFGFEKAVLDVYYPFLDRIGILWQTNNINPAHEHFVSNLIRQKMIAAIDAQSVIPADGERFILFLPEGELHELTLLFMHYILRARRYKVLYLSQNLPMADLQRAYEHFPAEYMVTSLTSAPDRDQVQPYLDSLSETFPKVTLLLNGYLTHQLSLRFPENMRRIYQIPDFIKFIDSLKK